MKHFQYSVMGHRILLRSLGWATKIAREISFPPPAHPSSYCTSWPVRHLQELNCLQHFPSIQNNNYFYPLLWPSCFMKLRSIDGSIISLTVVQWFLQPVKIPDVHTVAIRTRYLFMPLTRLVRFITAKVTRQTKFVPHTFEAWVCRLDFFVYSIESGQCPLCNITPFNRLSMDWKENTRTQKTQKWHRLLSNIENSILDIQYAGPKWRNRLSYCPS